MTEYIRILENNKEIASRILKALAEVLDPHFKAAIPKISSAVSDLVRRKIASSDEMKSLAGGVLQFDIGLTPGQAVETVNIFANAVASRVHIKYRPIKKSGRKLRGGINISIQPVTYGNIPDIPLSWEITSGKTADVKSLLLKLGDTLLVFEYDIEYGNFGRSGGAKMTKNMAGSWGLSSGVSRVPPSFSGTREKNFITRALQSQNFESELSSLLKEILSNK